MDSVGLKNELEMSASLLDRSNLINEKIVLTVKSDLVKGKILKVKTIKKPRKKRDKELALKIKTAKKLLKNKTDAIYVYTLLGRVGEEISKFNVQELENEERSMFVNMLNEVDSLLRNKLLAIGR